MHLSALVVQLCDFRCGAEAVALKVIEPVLDSVQLTVRARLCETIALMDGEAGEL